MKKSLGKILIIVLPIVAALLLLYPTYRASELEKIQQQVRTEAEKIKVPADSLAKIESFDRAYGKALQGAKANRVKLGLDLRGGMYVTLEVDVVKLLEESVQKDQSDDIFGDVITKTRQTASTSDLDVIDIFKGNFDQIARPKKKYLSDYFDFGGKGDLAETEENILKKLRDNEKEAIDQAMQVIRQRIDKYGISEPTIQKQGNRRIMLELPGVTNESEMTQLLQTTARLEFKLVKCDENLVSSFYKIDQYLSKLEKMGKALDSTALNEATNKDTTTKVTEKTDSVKSNEISASDSAKTDSTKADKAKSDTSDPYAGLSDDQKGKRYLKDHPFSTLFATYFLPSGKNQRSQQVDYRNNNFPKGDYSFQIFDEQLKKFELYLKRSDIKQIMPFDVQILLSAKADIGKDKNGKEIKAFTFYGLKSEPELTGDVVVDAVATFDPTNNQPIVNMAMNSDGSDRWARITGANLKKRIAIVLDNQVYSAPVVQSKIVGGNSQITGMSNAEEAKLLKIVLKAGALKAPVQMIEERIVGPSLGDDSIRSGLSSLLYAAIVAMLFMVIYYNKAGLLADAAVMINVLLIVAILAAFQGTLSLPGIAGIILTIGMALDANILIFERIREELYRGRSLKSAIDEGFSKALTAIIDTHLTTFITGLILFFMGTGPIKGFAMTLMMGVITTLFTAVVVSKAMMKLTTANATIYNFGQPKSLNA